MLSQQLTHDRSYISVLFFVFATVLQISKDILIFLFQAFLCNEINATHSKELKPREVFPPFSNGSHVPSPRTARANQAILCIAIESENFGQARDRFYIGSMYCVLGTNHENLQKKRLLIFEITLLVFPVSGN